MLLVGMILAGLLMGAGDYFNLAEKVGLTSPSADNASADLNSGNTSTPAQGNLTSAPKNPAGTPNSDHYTYPDMASLFEDVSPAVVKVNIYKRGGGQSSLQNDPWGWMFGDPYGQTAPIEGELQLIGHGTGFFFQKDGYILTNQHVTEGADEIRVKVPDLTKEIVATQLGSSSELDLSVIKVDPVDGKDFPTLAFLDPNEKLRIGEAVAAIGNPFEYDQTITSGIISANEREITIPDEQTRTNRTYKHLLQTNAQINSGNSGGPLVNMHGEVVGINSAVDATGQGIGFAIPSSVALENIEAMKNNETPKLAPAPYIGVSMVDVDEQAQKELNLDSANGVLIAEVVYASPAHRAGLQKYDVITAVNGEEVIDGEQFTALVAKKSVGDELKLTVQRLGRQGNQEMEITVTVGDKNEMQQLQPTGK